MRLLPIVLSLSLIALPVCADPQGGGPGGVPGPAANTSYQDACVFIAAGIAPVNAQQMALQCDSTGALKVNVIAGGSATITGPLGTQTSASSVAVTINPNGVTTTPTAYTVTTANTFQSVLAASATRKGCLLQNTNASGGDVEYVFFGANVSATKATSVQVSPGGAISCATGSGQVLTDNVSVTSAASGSDTGVVTSQ